MGWTGRRVEKQTCNHYTNIVWKVRITFAFLKPYMYRVVPDIPLCPPQDMLFTSVSRAATLPRQLAPCSWVPPSLFGFGATENGLMTMAATTFSPRTRTSTRFTEQGHVKKRPLLAGEMAKVVIGSMFSSPNHRTNCIFFQSAGVSDPEITHCSRAPYHEQ